MTKTPKRPVTSLYDVDALDELDRLAKSMGIKKSEIMRQALNAGLAVLGDAERRGLSPIAGLAALDAIREKHST